MSDRDVSPRSQNGATPRGGNGWEGTTPVPQYLQQGSSAARNGRRSHVAGKPGGAQESVCSDPAAAWSVIRQEAEADAKTEPLLSSFLYASILSHDSFERSLAFVLSNRLADTTLLSTELFEVFYSILRNKREVADAARADICAVRERDPACCSYSQALLYFKGYHAIQAHRIAHELWLAGRRVMACALQSRMSEVFAVDIHPAARIGSGILLDHGTGVVIGETAVVGNNVSVLQNVTLGGTGKAHGDRHPKIGDGVLIGASASILGNIEIGHGAQVAAGSLVLKPVPPHMMVAGSPASEIGVLSGNASERMEQWCECEDAGLQSRGEAGCSAEAGSSSEVGSSGVQATGTATQAAGQGLASDAMAEQQQRSSPQQRGQQGMGKGRQPEGDTEGVEYFI
eukprot:scaffold26.g3318.t1